MMKFFTLIVFFCVFSLNSSAQASCGGDEYLSTEYDCAEYMCSEEACDKGIVKPPLHIFPNPISEYFEVRNWVNTEGALFDVLGRFIRKVDVSKIVDVSDLASRIYFLKVDNQIAKIVKQ
jgi:hypothetical protein